MADETPRSPRSASTGAAPKGRARSTRSTAAPAESETPVETTAAAAPAPDVVASAPPQPEAPAAAAPAATPAPAPKPASSPRPGMTPDPAGSGSGVAMAGLLAGLIGIGLALSYPQWTPIVYGSAVSETRVTADQVRAESRAEIEALKATIATMAARQAGLEQAVNTAKLPGILMVAEDLRAALGESEPYAGTLNLFRALTGGDPEAAAIIAAVDDRAEVGIPSVDEVQDRFDEAAHAILMAEQRPESRGDLASQVSETVASLTAATIRLRWRLDGVPTGDSVAAVVARAEQSVMGGDFPTAIETLTVLPPDQAALAESWVAVAKARLSAGRSGRISTRTSSRRPRGSSRRGQDDPKSAGSSSRASRRISSDALVLGASSWGDAPWYEASWKTARSPILASRGLRPRAAS